MILYPIKDLKIGEIKKIADNYGKRTQTLKTIEELAELQQALCKMSVANELNNGYAEKKKIENNVIEEIADVIIMLNQLVYLYSLPDSELVDKIDFKIQRQLKRINGEEE